MTTNNPKDMDAEKILTEETAQETDLDRGPTIVMQGVSGKMITADVKVVKIRKKAKAPAAEPAKTPEPTTVAQPAAVETKPTKVQETPDVSTAKAQIQPAVVTAPAEQAKAPTEQPKAQAPAQPKPQPQAAPVQASARPQETPQPESKPVAKAPAAKTEEKVPQPAVKKEQKPVAKPAAQPAPAKPAPAKPAATSNAASSKPKTAEPKKPVIGAVVDPAKSSLAATAALFAAQAAARKKAAEQRVKQSRERNAAPNNRPPRNTNEGRFVPKDKDDEPKLQSHSRKPAPRRSALEREIMSNSREISRSTFAARDSAAASRRGGRMDRRNDTNNRGARGRFGGKNRGFFGEEEMFMRNRRRGRIKENRKPIVHTQMTNVGLPEVITVKELAEAIKKTAAEVIKALMKFGVMATLNQEVDYDTAAIIVGEFGITAEKVIEVTEEDILFDDSADNEADLLPRPPVVSVMGHVDHGKTSLLDRIRKASVADGEAGGITQHIGAYMVDVNGRKITFLDTPGHEAFTTMRARGAQATDIAILVVAADDGVMPQTVEAIHHAQAANTQIVVAINKIDRPGANPDRVKEELSKHELIPEEWGGTTVMVPVSAKTGEGVQDLLEMVLLTADILELRANPNRQAKGIVIEAKLDKHRGPVATLLVNRGTLHTGDTVVTGEIVGRIRAMNDASGKLLKEAGPSVPVEIMGMPEVPEAGEIFYQVADEKIARQLAEKRRIKKREDSIAGSSRMSLDTLFSQMSSGEVKDLNLIVKADVQGSVEAVDQAFNKLSTDEVRINIIHSAVGAVTETDLRLAEVSNAIVIGFNVRPAANVADMAKDAGIDLRLYRVIYHAIEDIENAMKGLLAPKLEEVELGRVEIRQVFKASNIGTIGGGYVTNGKIVRNCKARLVRDGIIIWDGKLASLKRFKDDVREVAQGYECGISLENYNDIKEGDVIETYQIEEIERE